MATSWPRFVERGPSVAAADVVAFERRLGHELPDDYRRFLLDVNGGRPGKESRELPEGVVNELLSLNETENESCDLATCNDRSRRDLPSPDLLVVGYDDGGGRLLLALAGERRGEVWMQITGDARPPDANPRVLWHDRRDMRKLADSFEAFLRSLRPLS